MITKLKFVDFEWKKEKASRIPLILLLREVMRKAKEDTYHPPEFSTRLLYGVSHKPDEPHCPL